MEHHYRTVVDGKSPEAALELVAIDDRAQCRPTPSARWPAAVGRSAPSGASGVPRRSRRARGAGTTRRQSAPGRGAAEGPARWRAAPAASHPRRGRCRAGSCAPPRGVGRPRQRRGSRRPLRPRVAPVRSDRDPQSLPPVRRPVSPDVHTVWAVSRPGRLNLSSSVVPAEFRPRRRPRHRAGPSQGASSTAARRASPVRRSRRPG